MNKKVTLALLICVIWVKILAAQSDAITERETFGASPITELRNAVDAPRNVTASDGLYDRYVLVHWEASQNSSRYKVFRTDKANGSSLQEISNSWQQGTWLCDYTALPGVVYYYTVMASSGNNNSKTSPFDKGFVKKNGVAENTNNTLTSNDRRLYANPNLVVLMPKAILTDKKTYKTGENVALTIKMENINTQPSRPTEVRCFLSTDVTLDWHDKNLKVKSLASIPAHATFDVRESVTLPNDILAGDYYLIIVSSSEGDILNSKAETVKISVMR